MKDYCEKCEKEVEVKTYWEIDDDYRECWEIICAECKYLINED